MIKKFIYDSSRTPFGRHSGALTLVRPDELLVSSIKKLIDEGDPLMAKRGSTLSLNGPITRAADRALIRSGDWEGLATAWTLAAFHLREPGC